MSRNEFTFLQHYTRWAPFSTDYSFAFDTSHTKVSSFSLQVAGPELPSLVKPFLSLLLALVPASDYGNYQVEGPFEYIQRNREKANRTESHRVYRKKAQAKERLQLLDYFHVNVHSRYQRSGMVRELKLPD